MPKPTSFELFAAFAAQLPLLTREDLETTVADLRGSPAWARVLLHARTQARAMGLTDEDFEAALDTGELPFSTERLTARA